MPGKDEGCAAAWRGGWLHCHMIVGRARRRGAAWRPMITAAAVDGAARE